MERPDLTYVQDLIKLCRKQGVTTIKLGGLELTLSENTPAPAKPRGKSAKRANHGEQGDIESDGWESLSDEEKLMWSSTGGTPLDSSETGPK